MQRIPARRPRPRATRLPQAPANRDGERHRIHQEARAHALRHHAIKLLKGVLLLLLALGVYSLSDNNLPEQFRGLLQFLHIDPEKEFFVDLAAKIGGISMVKMVWLSVGTGLYSLFSLVEGVGLIFRVSWAGWLAIGESAFFVPIELYELVHRYSFTVLGILALNVLIVWYLFQNRHRLFRHHHH